MNKLGWSDTNHSKTVLFFLFLFLMFLWMDFLAHLKILLILPLQPSRGQYYSYMFKRIKEEES